MTTYEGRTTLAVSSALFIASISACGGSTPASKTATDASDPIPIAKPVERGAVGDADLRTMLAEVASAKACEMMRGQYRPLHAVDKPDTVTGMMWIRDCKITNDGTKVTFDLSGNGWQWADQTQKKAGGTFGIKQYVKFGMTAKIPGALDVAYDKNDHVVSLWFTPAEIPEVTFTPVDGITVDKKGAWSWAVGSLGGVFGQSPEKLADEQAKEQGDHQLKKQLGDGLSVTIDLCSGLSRFGLGREPKGKMDVPEAGETKKVPIDLEPNALMVFGPEFVGPAGYTANVDAGAGNVHVDIACKDQVEQLTTAYIEGKPLPQIKTLASKDITGKGSVRVDKASCGQVSLVARPAIPNAPAFTFDWQRPPAEIAKSTGGSIISCGKK